MKVAFVLQAAGVTAAALREVVVAVAVQLQRDVGPAWGLSPAAVDPHVYRSVREVPADALPVVVLDDSDQAGALGYHDEQVDGRPYARVFAAGLSHDELTETISHEACEMYVDPLCNTYDRGADGRRYAREVCDPCQGQRYEVCGVQVSNFVLPAWADATPKPGARVDHLGALKGPLDVSPDGYVIVEGAGGDDTTEPAFATTAVKRHPASRTARRTRPR